MAGTDGKKISFGGIVKIWQLMWKKSKRMDKSCSTDFPFQVTQRMTGPLTEMGTQHLSRLDRHGTNKLRLELIDLELLAPIPAILK